MRAILASAAVCGVLMCGQGASAEAYPAELVEFFEMLGIEIPEVGEPPEAPPQPTTPGPTESTVITVTTPEEFAELFGIPLEALIPTGESAPPVSPQPSQQPREELAQLLGVPVEQLFPSIPSAPIPVTPPPAPAPGPSTPPRQSQEELASLLGLPVEVLFPVESAPVTPVPVVEPMTEDELLSFLLGAGVLGTPGPASAVSAPIRTPEPGTLALITLGIAVGVSRRR